MGLLAVTTVLLVTVSLTCSAERCGYRNRIRKPHTTQKYSTTAPTTTTRTTTVTTTGTTTTTPSTPSMPLSERTTTAPLTTRFTESTTTALVTNTTSTNNTGEGPDIESRHGHPKTTTLSKTTTTIVPHRECILKDGNRLKVGEKYTKSFPGACYVLECTPEGETVAIVKCAPPMCVDSVTPPGKCCPFCPEGNNCRLPSGEIITHPVVKDGRKCECPSNRSTVLGTTSTIYYTTAICTPLNDTNKTTSGSLTRTTTPVTSITANISSTTTKTTTTSTTRSPTPAATRATNRTSTNTTQHPCPSTKASSPQCLTKTGKRLRVGEKYTKSFPGGCYIFECTRERLVTKTLTCARPMCVDYVTPAGACCPSCPRGRNCKLPSGEIVSHPVIRGGKKCECPTKPKQPGGLPSAYNIAICRPLMKGTIKIPFRASLSRFGT